jgi:hypothetical protein
MRMPPKDRYPRRGGKSKKRDDTPRKGGSDGDVTYEVLHMKEIEYGENGFIEIAKKVRKKGREETTFYTIAKGFYGREDGERIIMGNKPGNQIIIPASEGVAEDVADALFAITPEGLSEDDEDE